MADEDFDVETMFDEIKEVRVEPDGKLCATDDKATRKAEAEQLELAVADFVRSWREFRFLDPMQYTDAGWWKSLQYLALADDRLKECFLGRDRSPASLRQYTRWRLHLADGRRRYRTDA